MIGIGTKDNVFRRLIFIAFAGRHCGGHLSLSAYKFHNPAPALPDFHTGAPGREMSSREMSFCSEQLHLVIYNTLIGTDIMTDQMSDWCIPRDPPPPKRGTETAMFTVWYVQAFLVVCWCII